MKKAQKINRKGESFKFGLLVIGASILLSLLALTSRQNSITGYAGYGANLQYQQVSQYSNLRQFDSFDSIKSLAAGNYFIDGNGIIYWMDDETKPAIVRVNLLRDLQKNRYIYIDNEGKIGYNIP